MDMAAQILAAQIRSGIFGLFGSFLNPTFGTGIQQVVANLLPGYIWKYWNSRFFWCRSKICKCFS